MPKIDGFSGRFNCVSDTQYITSWKQYNCRCSHSAFKQMISVFMAFIEDRFKSISSLKIPSIPDSL